MSKDVWAPLQAHTPSRIGLARSGVAMTTDDVLALDLAVAQARDAVALGMDGVALVEALAPLPCVTVHSLAPDRAAYIRNPGLGRRLHPDGAGVLRRRTCDLVLVVGDGLSARAANRHAAPLIHALMPLLGDLRVGPVVIAHQARVALGDEIAERIDARAVAMLIGERPGLTTPDSLGIYLTVNPRVGCLDADRNCISNIHDHGLAPQAAARKLAWLLREGLRLGFSGVNLKDREGDAPLLPHQGASADE